MAFLNPPAGALNDFTNLWFTYSYITSVVTFVSGLIYVRSYHRRAQAIGFAVDVAEKQHRPKKIKNT